MNVAVLTLTRDRLPYTQHCFATLEANAGCEYHHYVLDQGSTDGTAEWLGSRIHHDRLILLSENIGINGGLNLLLDVIDLADYDVIVKFDNDCELLTPNTLQAVSLEAFAGDMILSPRIYGLRNPVPIINRVGPVDVTPIVGGIFMATPAYVFQYGYRHRTDVGLWGSDDSDLCRHFKRDGHRVGYLRGYDANHYLTTDGQHADIPDYFARTLAEGKPSIL